MTRKLTLTIAIATLLLVGLVMEEGGPVDRIAKDGPQVELAENTAEPVEERSAVVLSKTQTPPPAAAQDDDDLWDWFNDDTSEVTAAPEPQTSQSRQSAAQRNGGQGSAPETGALDRSRMNLEE